MEDIRTPGSNGAAAGTVTAGVVMSTVTIFEAGQDLFPVVGDVAQAIIWVQNAASLGLQVVDGHPRIGTLKKMKTLLKL